MLKGFKNRLLQALFISFSLVSLAYCFLRSSLRPPQSYSRKFKNPIGLYLFCVTSCSVVNTAIEHNGTELTYIFIAVCVDTFPWYYAYVAHFRGRLIISCPNTLRGASAMSTYEMLNLLLSLAELLLLIQKYYKEK